MNYHNNNKLKIMYREIVNIVTKYENSLRFEYMSI